MDKIALEFGGFLGRVDAILDSWGYRLESQDVAFGDWRFDWFEAFVAGIRPSEAVEDAIAELRGRGLLDEEGDRTEEFAQSIDIWARACRETGRDS